MDALLNKMNLLNGCPIDKNMDAVLIKIELIRWMPIDKN